MAKNSWSLPPLIEAATPSSPVAISGLRGRTNERSDFLLTTTPPSVATDPATAAERYFPHLVNGGGYTTQFILFSGVAGQATSGNLQFFRAVDGTGLGLDLQ